MAAPDDNTRTMRGELERCRTINAALYAALEALVRASDGHAYSINERRNAIAVLAKARGENR